MRTRGAAVRALLLGTFFLILSLPAYADGVEYAGSTTSLKIVPGLVGVGINFGGADVLVEGAAPPDAEVIVKISTQPTMVKLSKKGRVMGIFWMTTERAVVENMPAFYALYSSQPPETLLSKEDRIRTGVDAECVGIMSQARVTSDSGERDPLPAQQAQEYVVGLRDLYIKTGRYMPCSMSCHGASPTAAASRSTEKKLKRGAIDLADGGWDLRLRLPADAPLGAYDVTAYYVKGSKMVSSQSGSFSVQKVGLVETLGAMATRNAPAYGALSLVVVVLVGLGIGLVFPKGKH